MARRSSCACPQFGERCSRRLVSRLSKDRQTLVRRRARCECDCQARQQLRPNHRVDQLSRTTSHPVEFGEVHVGNEMPTIGGNSRVIEPPKQRPPNTGVENTPDGSIFLRESALLFLWG